MLAQPLKRCSASRIKLNETSELAKKTQNIPEYVLCFVFRVLGCAGERIWLNVPRKWVDGLGQVHCQHGTFAKLRTSCPCEVEFEVVLCFLWRRLICPQNSSLRMFWYRDLNSSHFFPRFGLLENEANRTPDISATSIGSRKKFCKRKRMSVCPARKRKPNVLSVSYVLDRFNRCSRGRTTPLQILYRNMVRTW